jgi:hypothetical protein
MPKQQGFLATFRIDEELWGKFKDIAKNKQTNASALIIQYIQSVVSSRDVDNPPKATPPNIDTSPQPNLDDIYKYIDSKLDNLEDVSIQDIDNKIAESIADGDIKDAIATSYAAAMGQFNGLLEEFQLIKKQVQELQSIPSAPVPLATDIENLLGIGDILAGNPYDLNYLNNHIGYKLNEHKNQIEAALKIKLNLSDPKYICREFNKIVRALGLTIENKQINKIETYWIVK